MNTLTALLLAALFACDEAGDTADTTDTADTVVDTGDTGGSGASGSVEVPAVGELVDPDGCADITMLLASEDQTAALVFSDDTDLTTRAYLSGAPVTEVYSLPADGALSLHQGTYVTGLFCNDAFTDDMVIERTWAATAGTVTVTVTSEGVDHGHAKPARATILVEGAVLELDGEESVSVEAVQWEAAVGWLPG